ncbi:class III extradiol dioxygenase family protein [bacterium RCC_150]
MAEIVAGLGISHIPTLGAIMRERPNDPDTAIVYDTFEPVRSWIAEMELDAVVVIYNDHAAEFSLEMLPTFAIGAADSYRPADEGYGRSAVPTVPGDAELSWHIIDSVIPSGFDLVVCQSLDVDHGVTVPLTVVFGPAEDWPVPVVPIAVNVVQQPTPSAQRCFDLGVALGDALRSYSGSAKRIGVIGTGGMSHQLQGARAGHINEEFDRHFLSSIVDQPADLTRLTNAEYLTLAGSEGAELVMWLVMRGALSESVTADITGYHIPVSSTAAGLVALRNQPAA